MPSRPCPDCSRTVEERDVVCSCGGVPEERVYLRFVYAAFGIGVLTSAAARALGLAASFSMRDALMICTTVLLVAYPTAKWLQWRRRPERPVRAEMGSVFAKRFDRLLIIGLLVGCALIFLGVPSLWPRSGAPGGRYELVRLVWVWSSFLGGMIAMFAILRDQGLAFFDLRIANTYVLRYHGPRRR